MHMSTIDYKAECDTNAKDPSQANKFISLPFGSFKQKTNWKIYVLFIELMQIILQECNKISLGIGVLRVKTWIFKRMYTQESHNFKGSNFLLNESITGFTI